MFDFWLALRDLIGTIPTDVLNTIGWIFCGSIVFGILKSL